MSEHEIGLLRRKFIFASTLTLFIVMLMMGGLIYIFASRTAANEANQIIDYIVSHDGSLPKPTAEEIEPESAAAGADEDLPVEVESTAAESDLKEQMIWSLSDFFGTGNQLKDSQLTKNTRYFAVLYDENDHLEKIKSNINEGVDDGEALHYAEIARGRIFSRGSFGGYFYAVKDRVDARGKIVVYLDRSSQLAITMRVMYVSLILIGFGTLVVLLIMRTVSFRIVRPEIENAERQKRFITNASHELKTPLAVIRANTEMQEMLEGENEWTRSTLRQVSRLDGLIRNLVLITRSQENDKGLGLEWTDAATPLREMAETFKVVAESEGKTLTMEIPEGIELLTSDSKIRQLASILIDNAVKYCDDAGEIGVCLKRQGKYVLLEVSNNYADGANVDCSRFFDRFYRQDSSHQEKGGYGIGLSVAETLTREMLGRIGAVWKDGIITFSCRFRAK